ncbi:hypothetical protein [Riemerella anatipestifer]|uniref:hypothetical protein n=1 Tax=Riemerella anatipestifer TaxID=34085 RepID=UPI0023635EF7|nr:hypothetical protein [Riemerella anatipestifer]MDD1524158.1 hypothetical protein [Riemerella anatipestifer]MDY3520607.1 hypothetical protein [Riemerella anatipestifer]MDY3532340.1 hypothetical protein [Riemerella anatipestifer]MDY3535105.1 hypothetical protein [Riemerella anatipestifer]
MIIGNETENGAKHLEQLIEYGKSYNSILTNLEFVREGLGKITPNTPQIDEMIKCIDKALNELSQPKTTSSDEVNKLIEKTATF